MHRIWLALLCFLAFAPKLLAQDLVFSTVSREPFSLEISGQDTGFSVDLIQAIGADINKSVVLDRKDSFSAMLGAVQSAEVDGAIANISITAARESTMDFTLPIFASGIQVMLPSDGASNVLVTTILTREIALALVLAFGILFACGMVMWFLNANAKNTLTAPLWPHCSPRSGGR